MVISVPPDLADATERLVSEWESGQKVHRLWSGDSSLWSGADEDQWLGWLRIAGTHLGDLDRLLAFQQEIAAARFDHVVLLGMGGSSLCPEVLRRTFGRVTDAPDLSVLDSTDPAQVKSLDERIDYRRALFIVSSKSGTTLEPNIFLRYFSDRARCELGAGQYADRFIAVTDPGSQLATAAAEDGFRHVFEGVPSIGGRYSALSHFGLVPAAVMGLDVERLLARADAMQARCAPSTLLRENPGAMLGLTLGAAAQVARDKVTFVTSDGFQGLGAWLEQLLAESTGKRGLGLIPVDGETIGVPGVYGSDRVFVYLRDQTMPDPSQDLAIAELQRAGQAVIRLDLRDRYDVGAEFFRWEFATAVVGAVLGINPFDQPDVEASKIETRRLTSAYEADGMLPAEEPLVRDGQLAVYADEANGLALRAAGHGDSVEALVASQCERIGAGDYLALLVYVEMSPAHAEILQRVRHAVRDACRVATCVGFGPRFLHSTGQAYKGGPNTGVFFQVTCDDAQDIPVPGQRYSFGVVKAAQARGDFQVLGARARRALRVHVTGEVVQGLRRVEDLVAHGVARMR